MFDIGFSEMLVIGVVALIVIGPERLPGVARTMGHLFGRMQRYVNDVKSDIQREIELDELRKLRESVESSAREIEQSVSREFQAVEQEMHDLQALANPVEPEREKNSKASPAQGTGTEPLPAASEPGADPERSPAAGAAESASSAEQRSSPAAAPQPAVPAAAAEQPKQA